MANDGIKVVTELQEVLPPIPPGTPTGEEKPNIPGDPDYIAPYLDLEDCPVEVGLDCPVETIFTPGEGTVQFEFSLSYGCLAVPNLAKVRFGLVQASTLVASTIFVLPNDPPTFFEGTTNAAAGTYEIHIQYLDASNALLTGGDCNTTQTVTIT